MQRGQIIEVGKVRIDAGRLGGLDAGRLRG
jgi:hypothetical protein